MKAMILCAGFGTRLGELGKNSPKCLLEVSGKTVLQRIIEQLKGVGVTEVIINLHHLPGKIREYLSAKANFGLSLEFSVESEILDTGGGLKYAQHYFDGEKNFIMHNGDILSDIPLAELIAQHQSTNALATLALQKRNDTRTLLFDQGECLLGWENAAKNQRKLVREGEDFHRYSFTGIQVLSHRIFSIMREQSGFFSIIDTYLLAAKAGERIRAFDVTASRWIDVGTPERLEEARKMFK